MSDLHLSSLREAVKLSPDNTPLLLVFADACVQSWNFSEAMDVYESILSRDRDHADAHVGIAHILFKKGNLSEAIVRLEALIDKKRCPPSGLLLYSRISAAQGKFAHADELYRTAIALDPSMTDSAFEKELATPPSKKPPETDSSKKVPAASVSATGTAPQEDEIDSLLSSIAEEWNPAGTAITFDDVGGMHAVKEEIKMKILYPLNHPELFKAYGKKTGGGILLYGPPGCGKTLIAKAIAGEIQGCFISIGLHQILDMWLGNSEKNLHALFDMARQQRPAVLFIDEIDALAADRSTMKHGAGRTLINQLLLEMDSINAANDGVLIVAATNAPWHLDPAFRRPGRFDRMLFIPPPDADARDAILQILLRKKPVDAIDFKKIAQKAESFSGADLAAVVDVASEELLTRAMKENRVIPLTTSVVLGAVAKIKPSTRAWFETGKNYALFSNQSGFYDELLTYMGIKK